MEFNLEKAVRLGDKGENQSLYSFYLEELDLKTKQVSPQYVGWASNLHFDVSELVVERSLELMSSDGQPTLRHAIKGKLRPDTSDSLAAATYSFFGTDRPIEDFSIRIVRSSDEEQSKWPEVLLVCMNGIS